MIRPSAPIALVALLLAGCGGGGTQTGAESTAAQPGEGSPSGEATRRCAFLTASDIARVASVRPSQEEPLANAPGHRVRCSILFIDSSGQLILQLTESGGGPAALTSIRRGAASELGAAAVQPLAELGPGGFVARRVLAFARGRTIVELRTGYSDDGRLQLTPAQLRRLAAIVASRT
jgi:hypothetical protein